MYFYKLYRQLKRFMKEKESALYSQYIIDGVRCDASPAALLDECLEFSDFPDDESGYDDIIDESTEPPLASAEFDSAKTAEYVSRISEAACSERPFSLLYPDHFTRLQIARSLLDRLWSEGHFRLYNLRLWAQWDWNTRPIGNMASFYRSTEAASDYIFGLGVKMSDYLFIENDERCSAKFFAWLPDGDEDAARGEDTTDEEAAVAPEIPYTGETALFRSPFESRHPWIGNRRKCPATMVPDPQSWIIYIPFDTCPFRSGGSLLAQTYGQNGGQEPRIGDPDYFIDCYEVVRELVEDGIIKAGSTVADGGLATAAERMCQEAGLEMDIRGILSSYGETDPVKVLFGEVPGVLIQIGNNDYDYLDSQLILQDIAYYPVGRPSADITGLRLTDKPKKGVADILASLLEQATEGED